jgi:hypothetical protein
MIGRSLFVNMKYEPSKRMGSSQEAATYIRQHDKIKNKPAGQQKMQTNKVIVARMQVIATKNCAQKQTQWLLATICGLSLCVGARVGDVRVRS